jgi:hypothetical protein
MFGFNSGELSIALLIAILLMIGLWGPYLYEEIVRGKAKEGPRAPVGAGDTHPGTPRNPHRVIRRKSIPTTTARALAGKQEKPRSARQWFSRVVKNATLNAKCQMPNAETGGI